MDLLARLRINRAPIPVDRIAKELGATLLTVPLDAELSGMLVTRKDQVIIGVNSLHHPRRQRFTIAHEIGHLILHKDLMSSQVHVDKQFLAFRRDGKSSLGVDRTEVEANRFAAELLMPEFLLEPILSSQAFDVDDEEVVYALAAKYKVSKSAMSYRISALLDAFS